MIADGALRRAVFYYTHFSRIAQGGIFLSVYLAITPAALAALPAAPSFSLAVFSHALDAGGALTRCRAEMPQQGILMGLSDRGAKTLPRSDALCRAIVSECRAHGCRGVLADLDGSSCASILPFLEKLSRTLSVHAMKLYCPLALPAQGATLLVGTAVSGGSLRRMLEENVCRFGASRLALDLERVCMDFPLPCPSGCGTPLTQSAFHALRQAHPSSLYYSRSLMANYFTYTHEGCTHFVLFDDAQTLRQKYALARSLGIEDAFLMYPEVADILPELEGL